MAEQDSLRERLRAQDVAGFVAEDVTLVGGVDISFVKGSATGEACVSLVVVSLPSLRIVYVDCVPVRMTQPYIPGFLAFREVDFLVARIEHLRATRPGLVPQAILVDGNGVLHPRGFGLASHLGVLVGIPTVGVGKTLFALDGLEEHSVKRIAATRLRKGGDAMPLVGKSGRTWGVALRTMDDAPNPVFVSVGNDISLSSAVAIVRRCGRFRVPEPIRQADLQSRRYLREHHNEQ